MYTIYALCYQVREALFSSLASMELFDGSEVRVLDIFSGSGSIGLEALSRGLSTDIIVLILKETEPYIVIGKIAVHKHRNITFIVKCALFYVVSINILLVWLGASHATFVDMSSECISTALRNAHTCGFSQRANSACASALDALRAPQKHNLHGTYDLITLTPPYEEVVYADLIDAVCTSPLIKENTIVVIEYPEEMCKLPYILGDNKLFGVRNRKYGRTVLAIYVYRPGRKFDLRPNEFV